MLIDMICGIDCDVGIVRAAAFFIEEKLAFFPT